MKIDFHNQTIITGNDVHEVVFVPSESEEGLTHIAVRYQVLGDELEAGTNVFEYEDHYKCSCTGFRFKSICKHTKDLGHVKDDRTA